MRAMEKQIHSLVLSIEAVDLLGSRLSYWLRLVQLGLSAPALAKQARYAMCAMRFRGRTLPCLIEFQPCRRIQELSALGKYGQ